MTAARMRLLLLCRASREAVADAWLRRIMDLPDFTGTPVEEVRANVERCLDAFIARLEADPPALLERFVERLVRQRFETGFSIAAPLVAASHFRTAVREVLGEAAPDPDVLLAADELIDAFARLFSEAFSALSVAASEQRFHELFENAGDILVAWDEKGALTHANRRFEELVGERRDRWVGRPFGEIVLPEDRPLAERYVEALATGAPPEALRLRYVDAAGAVRKAVVNARAWRGRGGRSAVAIVRDVTDEEARQADAMQTERLSAVGQIAASTAHELNNPLSWLTTNLQQIERCILSSESLDEPGARARLAEMLADALVGVKRMENIVVDLRMYSRVREEQPHEFPLVDVIDLALRIAGPELRTRATVERSYDHLPPVCGRPGKLSQVFVNLFVNAAHALREGDVGQNRVRVAAEHRGGAVVVRVQDNGPGIPPEVAPRVFEPFFTTREDEGGTGLGLWVSRKIVEEHGGTLTLESEPGAGTTFTVTLPLRVASARPGAEPEPHPVGRSSARPTVLFVDDERMLLRSLEWEFEADHEVLTAPNGRAAVEVLARRGGRVDAILCDLTMPDMTGMDLYAVIAERWPSLLERLAFMSGGAFTRRARDFLAEVRPRLIDKPASLAQIRKVVRELVAGA